MTLHSWLTAACILFLGLSTAAPAAAQDDGYALDEDDEIAGRTRERPSEPDNPLRVVVFGGGGFGIRIVNNRDLEQTRLAPAYAEVGGQLYFPGRGIRHGVSLGVATNLSDDGAGALDIARQYVITPSYVLRVPLQYYVDGLEYDWLSISGRLGVPVAITNTDVQGGEELGVAWGVELAVGAVFKFLTGLGVYLDVSVDLYFGASNNVFPIVTPELGLIFSYEVL